MVLSLNLFIFKKSQYLRSTINITECDDSFPIPLLTIQ